MLNLALILVSLALFIGFLALTRVESRRGSRYFAGARSSFDSQIDRLSFIADHVDFAAFVRDGLRAASARIVHDIVHVTLIIVRFTERMLTRAVRALREHRIRIHEERSENGPDKE